MAVDPLLFSRLEATGESMVRLQVAQGLAGDAGSAHNNAVLAWLKSKDDERAAAREALAVEREVRLVASAEEANRIATAELEVARSSAASARSSARWALYAAITAVIAATISIKDQITELILWAL